MGLCRRAAPCGARERARNLGAAAILGGLLPAPLGFVMAPDSSTMVASGHVARSHLSCHDGARASRPAATVSSAVSPKKAVAAAAVAGAFAVASAKAYRRRGIRVFRSAFRDGSEGRLITNPSAKSPQPGDLYELLKVKKDADPREIRSAYYNLQKVCHPDVAGEEGEEMCMLLNDAYDVLSDPKERLVYDEELQATGQMTKAEPTTLDDYGPTWQWSPKQRGLPTWTGRPRSRSKHDAVKPEDRGPHWQAQEFVYVDEWQCISCRNCCDVAGHTFCIDVDHGRARAYTQWGNSEEYLDYAVAACPVDCIYWVSREELQALEYITAAEMHDSKGSLPCPMTIRQGVYQGIVPNPFDMAKDFTEKMKKKNQTSKGGYMVAVRFRDRIGQVFSNMKMGLRRAGWGW